MYIPAISAEVGPTIVTGAMSFRNIVTASGALFTVVRECVFEWAAVLGFVDSDIISLSHYTNRCEEDPLRGTVKE